MQNLFEDFFPREVKICFSPKHVDFTLPQNNLPLTRDQESYLSSQIDFSNQQVINIRQVHGAHILCMDEGYAKGSHEIREADGLITCRQGIALCIRTADCLPIFICDPVKKCIGLVHAGWRSSQKAIVAKAIEAMSQNWGCNLKDLLIAFGPGIRSCCYQVGEEFGDVFQDEIEKKEEGLFLDLALVNKHQMIDRGIEGNNIFDCELCTCCDDQFFSYRRQGADAGRHLSLMMLL